MNIIEIINIIKKDNINFIFQTIYNTNKPKNNKY